TIFCNDPRGNCTGEEPRIIQYALSQAGEVYNCPDLFNLPRFSTNLLQKDQVSSMLHELTHLEGIYFLPTKDLEYLHKEVLGLNTTSALQNADSYAYYAKAVCLAC
ncbi:zincin, partial [Terfezia boudieri ATCC MYA-4762]